MKIILPLILLVLVSCKTREDIAREQLVDNIATQMQDSQTVTADISSRIQAMEERLATVTGEVEEGDYKTKQTFSVKILQLEERLSVVEEGQKTTNETIETLKIQLAQQDKYLKEVLGTLKKLSGGSKSSRKAKPAKKLSAYDKAMLDYRKGRYKSAYPQLVTLLGSKKLSGSRKARILHNLGMIQFMAKKNDEAMVYFSRLFTEYPKAGYNKNGLLYLAKTFKRLKKNDEAKQVLTELVTKWPKAKQVKEAQKLLKAL